MDTALLAYSGISVKMLVDRAFGADHVTMFTVDYELGGAAQAHDHPFEEAYVFLDGRDRGRARRRHYTLRAGDVVFAGVGSVHGFYNEGTERVRWIETQAPQPPARHAYRWVRTWEQYERTRRRHADEPRIVGGGRRRWDSGDRPGDRASLRRSRATPWC